MLKFFNIVLFLIANLKKRKMKNIDFRMHHFRLIPKRIFLKKNGRKRFLSETYC